MTKTEKILTFSEACESIYVAVVRGLKTVILKVKKVMTHFVNGMMTRVIILSDGAHYYENTYKGNMWEVKKAA